MTATPLFRPSYRVEECLAAIRECLEAGWTGLGWKTIAFERAWKEYGGVAHAHFLNSNTSGLHLALCLLKRRHGWHDGDEHLCLDPVAIERRISPRTRAVMFVGMGGSPGQYERVVALFRERGSRSCSLPRTWPGRSSTERRCGTDANAAVFSFHAVKNLPIADAGMICLPSAEDDASARRLSWLGIDKDTYARVGGDGTYSWMYAGDEVGFKCHGNSIMAAIGLTQLKYLDTDNDHRRRLAAGYEARLRDQAGIGLVPLPAGCESSRHLYQIRVEDRDRLIDRLQQQGISAGVHYRDNTEYPMYGHGRGTCPAASAASRELVSLPMHFDLGEEDQDRIAERVVDAARSNAAAGRGAGTER